MQRGLKPCFFKRSYSSRSLERKEFNYILLSSSDMTAFLFSQVYPRKRQEAWWICGYLTGSACPYYWKVLGTERSQNPQKHYFINTLGVALKTYMTELLKQSVFYILKVIIMSKSNLAALAVVSTLIYCNGTNHIEMHDWAQNTSHLVTAFTDFLWYCHAPLQNLLISHVLFKKKFTSNVSSFFLLCFLLGLGF